ncbi:MAG: hypothetical protein R3E93_15905 [Thiothrix sp.]
MSKSLSTNGVEFSTLKTAINRAAGLADTYQKGMFACKALSDLYRTRAQECQRLAAMFDREAAANASLLQLSLTEKWRLEDAGREVCQ